MKRNHSFFLKALLLIILTSFYSNANALLPYKYNWTKIKSAHFTIIIDQEFIDYGNLVAAKAEQAFTALQKFSSKHPKNTFIIVDHTKGFSNGSATYFPYARITLQPLTPAPSTSVGQYEDWLYELLVHEYTHILSFHNTKGLFTPLRWIFGSAISPGHYMPNWYLEGIAVYTETQLSNGGRLRGSSYQALKEELKSPNIAIANENNTNHYPFGSNPYIYGGWLNQDAFSELGIEGAAKVHAGFSGRIPYFINSGYKKHTGKSLYKSWRNLFGKNKNKVETKPLKGLVKGLDQGKMPLWLSSNETLYYIQRDPYGFDEMMELKKENPPKKIFKARNILDYKVYNNKIYYLNMRLLKKEQDHQIFSLYSFPLDQENPSPQLLTGRENIQSFDISSDGKIAFVDASIRQQHLKMAELKDAELINTKTLFSSATTDRLALVNFRTPQEILFALKKTNTPETITSLNLKSLKTQTLLTAQHIVDLKRTTSGLSHTPGNKSDDKSDDFYVLTEKDGIKKLQRLSDKTKFQVLKGIQSLTVLPARFLAKPKSDSPSDDTFFAVSRITSKGPYIFTTSLKEMKSSTPLYKVVNSEDSPKKIKDSELEFTQRKYSSFSMLKPHYIVPVVSVSPYGFSGEFLYGLNIGSQDPLGLNSYSVSAFTDTITQKASSTLSYTSQHFRMPVFLSGGLSNEPLSLSIFRESTFAQLGTEFLLNQSLSKQFKLNLSAAWSSTGLTEDFDIKRLGAQASLSYANAEQRLRELAPRKGLSFLLTTKHYLPDAGYIDYTKTSGGMKLYFTSPIHKTHRLILGFDAEVNNESLPLIFSANSLNQPYRNTAPGGFALRGLPTGTVFATDSFAMGHLEYRFPLLNINWGPGLLPGFFNRITGALTADYGTVKGFNFINESLIEHSTPLYSAGLELVFEGTLFYHLPASLQIGAYKFLNSDVYSGSPELFVGFGVSGLPY